MKTTMRLGQRSWDEWLMKIDVRELVRSGIMLMLLVAVLSFERTIGMPSWSALLMCYLGVQMDWTERGIWLGVVALLLGAVYTVPFAAALVIISLSVATYLYLPIVIRSESVRLLAASLVVVISVGGLTQLNPSVVGFVFEFLKTLLGVLVARWLIVGSTTQRGLSVSKRMRFLGLFSERELSR